MKIPVQRPGKDGFTPWITPIMSGYRFACCDCGLVHDLQFRVIQTDPQADGTFTFNDSFQFHPTIRVQMRARRNNRSTAAVRRKKKI